jgi:hypothetical protein
MAVTFTSPITGLAQTGLTTPTYTHVADLAPDANGRQVAVTALGGTQTGVTTHSGSNPFTLTVVRPKVLKGLGKANPVTGVISNVPKNTYKYIVRKGMVPLLGQAPAIAIFTLTMDVPAGADVASAPEIRAALSCLFGGASQQSAGFGDTLVTGIL